MPATQVKPSIQSASRELPVPIKPVTDEIGPLKMIAYAQNKVGKTRFGGSSGLKTLVIETEPQGIETLTGLGLENVDYVQITKWEQLDPYFWFLYEGKHDYEVVVIDTMTMLSTLCLRYVMGQVTGAQDPLMPKGDHYNKLAQILNNEVMRWVMLPMHVIFLAQERNFTVRLPDEEEDSLQKIGPGMTPSVAFTLMGAVGTIGHMFIKEVKTEDNKKTMQRRMHLAPNPLYYAGTRVRGLPDIMANPTLAAILDIRAKTGELPPESLPVWEAVEADAEDEDETPEGVEMQTL